MPQEEVKLVYAPPESPNSNLYSSTWSILQANIAQKNPQTGDDAARFVAILGSVLQRNPGHPVLDEVRAELARLEEIERRHPRTRFEMSMPNGTRVVVLWSRLEASVDQVSRRTAASTTQRLDDLIVANPEHPKVGELRELRRRVDVMLKVVPAVMTARYYAGAAAVSKAQTMVRGEHWMGQPKQLFGHMLHAFYAPKPGSKPSPGALTSGMRAPTAAAGPGRRLFTDSVSSFVCRELGAQVPGLKNPWGDPCRKGAWSTWTKALVGKTLYTSKGKMDARALDKVLTALYVAPGETFLGLPAREVYEMYVPTVRVHMRMWKNIRKYGARKILREYRAKLKQTQKSGEHMRYVFYEKPDRYKGLLQGLDVKSWRAPELFGFWLRRMDDGTEKVLLKHAKKVLKVYDPEFYKEIF